MKESFEMKKALSIPVALLGALLTVGCQTEKMPVEEVDAGSRTLRVIADSDDTRTSIFQDEETGKYQVRWDETDRLFLVEMIYANMTDDIEHAAWGYRAEPTTLEDDGRRAIFDFELEDNQEFLPENEVFRYIGFYPSYQSIVRPGQEFTVEDWENFWEEEYTSYHVMLVGDISSYQYPRAESFDPNSDVLISRMVESAVQPDELHFQFARIGSVVKITLNRFTSFVCVTYILTLDDNFKCLTTIDLCGLDCYSILTIARCYHIDYQSLICYCLENIFIIHTINSLGLSPILKNFRFLMSLL